jgi:hypothetical protein
MGWPWPWKSANISLFLDNTGVHSGGLALEHAARGEADVTGLLQLGILVVFADELHWTTIESEAVARRSREISEHLRHLGVGADMLKTAEDPNEYNICAADTAETIADELSLGFELTELEVNSLAPTKIDGDLLKVVPKWLEIALAPEGSIDYATLRQQFQLEKAPSVTALMVSESSTLRRSLRRLHSESPNWSGAHSAQLDAFLRYARNDAHARRRHSSYVPAVGRAILVRDRNRLIIENVVAQISKQVDEITEQIRGTPIALPALAAALVERSLGEPEGVIKNALELREKAAPLRKWLRSAWAKIDHSVINRKQRIRQIVELRRQLEVSLGLREKTRAADAINITVLPIPKITINAGKLVEMTKERWRARKFSVLTEMSNSAIFDYKEHVQYGKLIKKAQERRE